MEVAGIVIGVVAEIRDIARGIKENDKQAWRLCERVVAIEPTVQAVHQGTKRLTSQSLDQLLGTLRKIHSFLKMYAKSNIVDRAVKRKSTAAKIAGFRVLLSEWIQAVHLDVSVDDWASQDASDLREDFASLTNLLEEIDRNGTANHAEVMGALEVSIFCGAP